MQRGTAQAHVGKNDWALPAWFLLLVVYLGKEAGPQTFTPGLQNFFEQRLKALTKRDKQ